MNIVSCRVTRHIRAQVSQNTTLANDFFGFKPFGYPSVSEVEVVRDRLHTSL